MDWWKSQIAWFPSTNWTSSEACTILGHKIIQQQALISGNICQVSGTYSYINHTSHTCSNYSRSQTLPIVSGSGSSNFYRPPVTYRTAPPEQSRLMNISNTRMLYRPPANSFLVKVPPLPQSPESSVLLCSDCDTKFADNKSLVKHTRNQHQVYQCSKCGESTVGYYRMASHTKRNHSKEPVFFCNCGRNFSEKRGLTKHQNSCTFYNSQWFSMF